MVGFRIRRQQMENWTEKGVERRHLVLIPAPFQGHINPLLQLAAILHAHGFSITIAHTPFNAPDAPSFPDFTFLSVPDGLTDGDAANNNSVHIALVVNANWGTTLKQVLSRGTDKREVACIVYDEMMYSVSLVAHDLGIPSIMLRTSNAATLLSRSALFKLKEEGRIPVPDSMLMNLVPDHQPLRFKDLPLSASFGSVEIFWTLLVNMSNVRTASAIIVNTIECLESEEIAKLQQQCQIPVFPIGPIHKLPPKISFSMSLMVEDSSCLDWLDKQEPDSVLYISFGSVAWIEREELTELAHGLMSCQKPFLWVIRPGSVRGLEWKENGLPEDFGEFVARKGCIVKWAPQKEVLAHSAIRGFWSHCGWNSTMESIIEGVPMICKPCFGDQKVTARYVCEVWRIGLHYEKDRLRRGDVEGVVRRLMEEREGSDMRNRAKSLQEKVKASTRNHGNSLRSLNQLVDFMQSY